MGRNCKGKCWKIGLMVLVGIAVMGLVVMALWNWLVPSLFVGMKEITYLQALGILVLSKILFGGLRGHGCHGRWHRRRWEQMTPEEREKFRAGMRSCCGGSSAEAVENKD
jgi:hypothetical protein